MQHESLTDTSKRGVQLKGHLFFKGSIGDLEDLSTDFDCISTNLKIYQRILTVYQQI